MSTDPKPGAGQPPAVEDLDHHECWRLLRGVSVGRLAVWVDDHPDIFPINYTVDHGTLVFRTGDGTKLQAATGDTPVAVEADGVDADTGIAWSVVIKGQAAPVRNQQEVLETVGLQLFPWQPGRKEHFVRITPDTVTGRRFKVAPPLTWWTPLDGTTPSAPE
ncbi:pyridoxamine 5'-phosphate oxidase family protein [Arthrobacter sp. UYCu712]|uniref:pyridoxamine 5'-phosphate oxidase family protein n=1 Tax=Arthrobacter sp. UYCu712 TaxID=3156340 RepID=UPI003394C856